MTTGSGPTDPRLERLGERIDELRERDRERTGTDDEPRFIDAGEPAEEVDNTIVPPG